MLLGEWAWNIGFKDDVKKIKTYKDYVNFHERLHTAIELLKDTEQMLNEVYIDSGVIGPGQVWEKINSLEDK